jgi:hypothetical protein
MNKAKQDQLSALIAELSEEMMRDSERWFGESGTVRDFRFLALALCGEAGEYANVVKKIWRGSADPKSPAVRTQLAGEQTDILIYLLLGAHVQGMDLIKCYYNNVRPANEKRFGNAK